MATPEKKPEGEAPSAAGPSQPAAGPQSPKPAVKPEGTEPSVAGPSQPAAGPQSPQPTAEAKAASATGSAEPISSFPSLESLRLPQHFLESVGVKKVLLNVPMRKPGKQEFVRAHSDENYRINILTLELGGGDTRPELYLVHPDISAALEGEVKMVTLFTTISRQGAVFLWPVTIPPVGGRQMLWHLSMREAAHLGMKWWIRVKANMAAGCYDVFKAEAQDIEPAWPADLPSLHGLLELASKDGRLIKTYDHPALKALRGG